MDDQIVSSDDFDVVAVGGGFAGLVAAARAAQLGLKAAVLEQQTEQRHLCNSRYTTGVFSIASQATHAPAADLVAAIMTETDGTAKREVVEAIAATASRAADWLTAEGMRFVAITNAGGRKLMLGPPRRYKEGLDWEGRGGDFLLRRLEENLLSRGGRFLRGTRAESLVMEGSRCVGVHAVQNGERVRISARNVVLADGGYHANPELIRQYLSPRPERVLVRGAPTARGDGLRMAAEAGAALSGFGSFYGHLHHLDALKNERLWPYPHFDAVAEVSMLVGSDARRFTDEGEGGVYMANAVARLADPASAVVIFDDAVWNGAAGKASGFPLNPLLLSGGGWLHSAADIAALAAKAGLPAEALETTVREYNAAVRENRIDSLQPKRTTRRAKPLPIDKAPFHAAPLCAGLTQTMGGVEINAHAQALRPGGTAIEGLYLAGAPVAHVEGGPRAGYTGGLCKAFTLGLLAAEHIAQEHRVS
jgi:fumarate reductase flavoprotein subunit